MEDAKVLDRLAGTGRIAGDWVDGLRAVDPHIDAKIDSSLKRVAEAGECLPHEGEPNAVIWRAYELPLAKVRVLILGQDPYPSVKNATGLSFSTGPNGDVPDSLANVYRELCPDADAATLTGSS